VAASGAWCCPKHTDHAGVMWHGAYLGWFGGGPGGSPASSGGYSALSGSGGLELAGGGLGDGLPGTPGGMADAVEGAAWWNRAGGYVLIWSSRFSMGGVNWPRRRGWTWWLLDLGPDRGPAPTVRH